MPLDINGPISMSVKVSNFSLDLATLKFNFYLKRAQNVCLSLPF